MSRICADKTEFNQVLRKHRSLFEACLITISNIVQSSFYRMISCNLTKMTLFLHLCRLLGTRKFWKAIHTWNNDSNCVTLTSQHWTCAKRTLWNEYVTLTTMSSWGPTSQRNTTNQNRPLSSWNWTQRAITPLDWRIPSSWQWRVLLLECRTQVKSIASSSSRFLFNSVSQALDVRLVFWVINRCIASGKPARFFRFVCPPNNSTSWMCFDQHCMF